MISIDIHYIHDIHGIPGYPFQERALVSCLAGATPSQNVSGTFSLYIFFPRFTLQLEHQL